MNHLNLDTLPGPAKLEIQVWDYDGIGDDLIGKTFIDIEDRYCSEWRKWKDETKNIMPLEHRILKLDDSEQSQGSLELWMDY